MHLHLHLPLTHPVANACPVWPSVLAAPQSRFMRPNWVRLHLPLLCVLWARRRGCFDYSRPFLLGRGAQLVQRGARAAGVRAPAAHPAAQDKPGAV